MKSEQHKENIMKNMKAAQLLISMVLVAAFFLVSSITVSAAEYVSVAKDGGESPFRS